jgi:pimeloyl-ACP methyl ester carboxylesterase
MDGSGVLLRGLVEHLAVFRPVRVIPFPNDKPLTYEELTAHVLKRLPDSRFVLLGESFSGPIAIEIAARQQRIAGLVLAASFARHPMPALFSPLTRMLDLRWVPARLVETALLGLRQHWTSERRFVECSRRSPAKSSEPGPRRSSASTSATDFARLTAQYSTCTRVLTDWFPGSAWRRSFHRARTRGADARCPAHGSGDSPS